MGTDNLFFESPGFATMLMCLASNG